MKILILNGPNLNLLGIRQPEIYGKEGFEEYFEPLKRNFPKCDLTYIQSNFEGEIIDALHTYGFIVDGIILNAGAYTHTSIAISDAVASITTAVIEVHISNIHAREEYRHKSYLAKHCIGSIVGFGLSGYELAIIHFLNKHSTQNS